MAGKWDKHSQTESEARRVLWDNLREAIVNPGVGCSSEWAVEQGRDTVRATVSVSS